MTKILDLNETPDNKNCSMKKSYVYDIYVNDRCTAELADDTVSHEPARYPEYYYLLTVSPI